MTFPKFHDLRSRLAEAARRADEQTPESIRATVAFVLDSLDQAAGRAPDVAPVPAQPAAVPEAVAKDAAPEYAWSLCGEEYHDRLDTREAAIAELDGSGGFTGRVVDAYDACGECDIAEVIVHQVESWLSDSVTSGDFIIEVTEEQKGALNTIVWQWFYKNVTPNRWTVTDVQQHAAAILSAADTEVKNNV